MNPNYTEFKFPAIRAHPWSKVFSKRLPPDAVDLVRVYSFPLSSSSCQVMAHCWSEVCSQCQPSDPQAAGPDASNRKCM